jgi:monoamine oxidase
MGPGLKLTYRFDTPIAPPDLAAFYSPRVPPMWWTPAFGRDAVDQVWTALATGDWARELLAMGEQAALEHGLRVLQTELKRPDCQPADMRMVNWTADPYSLGAYSVTPPGGIDNPAALAAPVAGRLFWAGEATAHVAWTATVHGAYDSGRRAAAEALSNL